MRVGRSRDRGPIGAGGMAEAAQRLGEQLADAPSWFQAARLVEDHRELVAPAAVWLKSESVRLVEQGAGASVARANQLAACHALLDAAARMPATRALARVVRFAPLKSQEGRAQDEAWVQSLIAELAGLPSWTARRAFLEENQFLVSKLGASVAYRFAEQADTEWGRGIALFLRDCVWLGIAEATLQGAVDEVLRVADNDAAREVADAYPRVLTTHAGDLARERIAGIADPQGQAAAQARWTAVGQCRATATTDPTYLADLEFADRLDELGEMYEQKDLSAYLGNHSELATETARAALARRRDSESTFRHRWRWDGYLRLLQDVQRQDDAPDGYGAHVSAAVETFSSRQFYEDHTGSLAALHAASDDELYLLHLAYPRLHAVHGAQAIAAFGPGGRNTAELYRANAELVRFEAADRAARDWKLPAADWDGRVLSSRRSVDLKRHAFDLAEQVVGPDSATVLSPLFVLNPLFSGDPPAGLVHVIGLLEVLARIGTLAPTDAAQVAGAAAQLHRKWSIAMAPGGRLRAAAVGRYVELLEQFAASAPPDQEEAALRGLATGYWTRFSEQGRPADKDAAVTTARRALPEQTRDKTPADIADLLTSITGLS